MPEIQAWEDLAALEQALSLIHLCLIEVLDSADSLAMMYGCGNRGSFSPLPPCGPDWISNPTLCQLLLQGLQELRPVYQEVLHRFSDQCEADPAQFGEPSCALWIYLDQVELAIYRQARPAGNSVAAPQTCPLAQQDKAPEQPCAQRTLAHLPVAIYRCRADQDWTMMALTEGIQTLTGYTTADFINNSQLSLDRLIHPEDRNRVRWEVQAALAARRPFAVEYRYVTASQTLGWMVDQGQGVWDETGTLQFLDGILMDITAHKQAEEQLMLLSAASDQSPASIVITDSQGYIQYVNPKFEAVTGYTAAEVKGQNPRILKTGHTPTEQYRQLWETITSGKTWTGEFLNRKKNGDFFWETASISPVKDRNGQITHFVAVKEDITGHKETIELLTYQAHYDLLTDLPNRALAIDHLKLAIEQAEHEGEYVAVLLIDLDNFKTINESIGHDVGDLLLCHVAERLKQQIQPGNTLARLGGDEFLIILQGLKDLASVLPFGHRLLDIIEQPYLLKNVECYTSASVGVATYPLDSHSSSGLLRSADIALYNAKNSGRKNIKCFESGMNLKAQRRHQVANQLRRALEFGELYLVYQPLVDLRQGCVAGAEALLRWQNPSLGAVSPAEFIPVAEETGLILAIGDWVIQAACEQISQWQPRLSDTFSLAINLSPRQFRTSRLAETLTETLHRYHISPQQLELEITESLLLDDQPATQALMQQLKAMGLRLSIDDFGTGYSALSYLRRFSLDVLKIDRSFITGLPHHQDLGSLVRAIIYMAHELNLQVIAEGIETHEQLTFLESQGCDYGQGFWFSRALQPQDFAQFALQGMACNG